MAKKKRSSLDTARELADILLYKSTNGAMGKEYDTSKGDINVPEVRGLLDTILRIHALELKGPDEDENQPSAFEILQKGAKDVSKKAKSGSFEATMQRAAEAKRAELAGSGADGE